jgi:hypothetical protein
VSGNEKEQKLVVSKADAATRQLDCAIRLWFSGGDPVSIHTLVGAAYQIIHDMNKKRDGKDLLFDADFIKEEHRKTVHDLMRRDFNFFKHADTDTHEVTEFVPFASIMFMLIGIQTLRNLGVRQTDAQMTFGIYMALTRSEYINEEFRALLLATVPVEYIADVRGMDKEEFFKLSLQAAAALRAQGKIP